MKNRQEDDELELWTITRRQINMEFSVEVDEDET